MNRECLMHRLFTEQPLPWLWTMGKSNIWCMKTTFKERYGNDVRDLKQEKFKNSTALAKFVCRRQYMFLLIEKFQAKFMALLKKACGNYV